MPNNSNIPVGRNRLFYSEEDFDFETDLMLEYYEEDLNQTIVVYPIDRARTQINAITQNATNGIRFLAPVELPCMFEIEQSQMKSYDKRTSNGAYSLIGNLTVHMLVKTLEKYDCDISRGDYIGVPIEPGRMVYFVVNDDGKVNTANTNYIGAFRTAWRLIKCSPASDFEFKGE